MQESAGARTPLIAPDTIVALAAVVIASALAWWWLIAAHGGMSTPDAGMDAMPAMGWTPAYAVSMFVMWTIMMVAMMLPSALPMILLHARTAKDSRFATVAFASAYLAVWTGFSALATIAQWLLSEIGVLNEAMQLHSNVLAAVLLAGAGIYQLTPLKQLCLSHCRAPLTFLMQHWRPGVYGAIRMGLAHGAYCVGCCWFIMALLFAGGVMNLIWIALLAAFVMAERLLPFGDLVGKMAGVGAMGLAVYVLAAGT
ncbi:MAG: DUF2182 domain-containing protein [Alphaproteobacteria bacterium]|nr:DUF2182 domain-containing protein [Alphaproteobacteria bacterium]